MIRGTIKDTNKAIITPKSLGGVEPVFIVIYLGFAGMILLATFPSLQSLIAIVVAVSGHFIGRAVFKSDPYFFRLWRKYNNYTKASTRFLPAQTSIHKSDDFSFDTPRSIVVKGVKKVK